MATVTVAPTCTAQGYDENTCSFCGFVEKTNYTSILPHSYNENYSFDNSYHWIGCKGCDDKISYAEHNIDDSGCCTVCEQPLAPTEGIIYDLSADGTYAEVIGYEGTATKILIADTYKGFPVTNIYNEAFKSEKITSLIIPNSVTSIGDYAFYYCRSLTSVTIPDSVTSIGEFAFFGCSSLTSITIPDSVTSIGSYAFCDCSSLTSVTIPDSVTSVGGEAFSNCHSSLYTEYEFGTYVGDANNPYAILYGLTNKNLSTYTINENTKIIGTGVFSQCARLTNITIPNSFTSIGDYAFDGCTSLTSVTIPDSVTSIGEMAFRSCTSLTSVTIPDSVTSIDDYAFCSCTGLTSVTIPDSVTSIGERAFYDCSSLTSVTIGNSVTSIGSYAFYYCTSLTSVTIPDSVTSIGEWAFYDCSSLTSITIPDSVASIGEGAFWGCSNLKNVYYTGSKEEWDNIDIGSYNYELTSATIHYNYVPEEE